MFVFRTVLMVREGSPMHRHSLVYSGALLLSLFSGGFGIAAEITTGTVLKILGDNPPEPPAGFTTSEEAIEAVRGGEVKIINAFEPFDGVAFEKDIEYGRVGDRPLLLDVYSPAGLDKPVPAILFIHGGGWKGGNKADYRIYGIKFAQRGYVVASVSYRLSGEAKFPAALEDVKCAVRWVRANAERLHVNPDKIGIAGGSAGGHLSLMTGLTPGVAEFEGTGGHDGTSSAVQCVVNIYGPTDLTTPFAQNLSHEGGLLHQFLGKTFDEDAALYRKASPITYVTKDAPPILTLHGTVDDVVPIDQADLLAKKLRELDHPYIYDRLPGWPHTMDLAADVNDRSVWFMERFFAHYLKGEKNSSAGAGQ